MAESFDVEEKKLSEEIFDVEKEVSEEKKVSKESFDVEEIKLSDKSSVAIYRNIVSLTSDEFEAFWASKPDVRHKIMMFGALVEIPRYQKLYGAGNYSFSGTVSYGDPVIPELVAKCFEIANKLFPIFSWNGALVNWYPDGTSYIGAHSDDEKDLLANAPILSFSFGAERIFRIKAKIADKFVNKYDFVTENCSMIAMMGSMQKEFKHEITKTAKIVGRRINVTIRAFKNF